MKAVKALQELHPDWPVWQRRYGHPPGVALGRAFTGRAELWAAGAHCQYFNGIASAGAGNPADAIVLSGGYEDDSDLGDYFFYVGMGGRKGGSLVQTHDQDFTLGNAALRENCRQAVPVRVMRGAKT